MPIGEGDNGSSVSTIARKRKEKNVRICLRRGLSSPLSLLFYGEDFDSNSRIVGEEMICLAWFFFISY